MLPQKELKGPAGRPHHISEDIERIEGQVDEVVDDDDDARTIIRDLPQGGGQRQGLHSDPRSRVEGHRVRSVDDGGVQPGNLEGPTNMWLWNIGSLCLSLYLNDKKLFHSSLFFLKCEARWFTKKRFQIFILIPCALEGRFPEMQRAKVGKAGEILNCI